MSPVNVTVHWLNTGYFSLLEFSLLLGDMVFNGACIISGQSSKYARWQSFISGMCISMCVLLS